MNRMNSKNARIGLVSLIAIAGMAAMGPRVSKEGNAEHREKLSEIEAQPFSSELFAGLDSWTHDQVLDSESIQGKVVLIAVVQAAEPKSMMSLASLARYQRKNGDDGLVALAVHPEEGWDAFQEKVSSGRIKVQAARDVGSTFADGLHTDNYPDLYLIDRAGQLRYADFENKSLNIAITQLLRETPEEAIANAAVEAKGLEVAQASKDNEPKEIDPKLYEEASWPSMNKGKLSALNYQGKELPVKLGGEVWLTEEKSLENKVLVLDFWATWCGPCRAASPLLEEMQTKYEGKLEVLAIGGASDDEARHRKYVIKNKKAYSNLYDSNDSIYNALQVKGIPHTLIISTDGVIRWQGNPLSPDFKKALNQVMDIDPMFAED